MNLGNNYGPGDLKYKDINGDGVVDSDDRTIIGNPTLILPMVVPLPLITKVLTWE